MSWKLLQGDCLEIMPALPDKSVDMILCDLPYGTTACKWDTIIPFEPLWKQYERIIKDNGAIVLTACQPFTAMLVMSNIKRFRYDFIWDKAITTGHLNAKLRPLRQHEDILVFSLEKPRYYPITKTGRARWKGSEKGNVGDGLTCYGKSKGHKSYSNIYYPTSILRKSNADRTRRLHPTQKPVALFEYLIRTYTNPGETVLDNCAGSGTTGVAAENVGRNSIMIEIDPAYCETIKKRMANRQQTLFEKGVSL